MKLHQKLFWLFVFLLPLQLGRHFWPNFSLVLGLRIDYLAPTIYLTDILVFLILLLWIFDFIIHYPLSIIHFLKEYWWVIVIFIYLLVNALLAQNQGTALYYFLKIIELTLLGFYISKNKISLSIIHYPLSIAIVYSSLIALAQFFRQSSLNGLAWWLGERTFNLATPGIAKAILNGRLILRPYGTFPHPNVLAGFVLVVLVLLQNTSDGGPKGLLRGEVIKKILCWLALILGVVTIAFSFSRSVWLIGLLVSGWLIFSKTPRMVAKQRLRLLRGGGIFLIIVLVTLLLFKLPFSTNEAFFQRLQLVKASVLMIRTSPLSGVGLNNFIVRLPEFWPMTGFTYWLQPVHNIYLLILTETGIVGLLIFVWLLILTYRRLLKTLTINHWPLIISLAAILLLGLVDHYWVTLQQTQLLLAVILGLAWSSKI